MNVTTVKVHQETKEALDEFKEKSESYDEIINKLISKVKSKNIVKELTEAYKSKAKEDRKLAKEWEDSSPGWE
jgi:uncharacterized protein YjgD (DUF1641 family)